MNNSWVQEGHITDSLGDGELKEGSLEDFWVEGQALVLIPLFNPYPSSMGLLMYFQVELKAIINATRVKSKNTETCFLLIYSFLLIFVDRRNFTCYAIKPTATELYLIRKLRIFINKTMSEEIQLMSSMLQVATRTSDILDS